jgi:hypothetical protein
LAAARDLDDIFESALETPDEGVEGVTQLLFSRLRKNSRSVRKDIPQGLKPNVFSIVYGTTEVVP